MNVSSLQKVRLNTNQFKFRNYASVPKHLDTLSRASVKAVNNVQVVTQPVDSDASSVSVWVKSGSALETREQQGVANLLRAVLTSNIAKEASQVGARVSSSSSREYTQYRVDCLQEHVPKVLSILGNSFSSGSPLTQESINAARDQILREQRNCIDHPDREVILDYLHSSAYQQSSYANAPLGNKSGVNGATVQSLQEFRDSFYNSNGVYLSTASSQSASAIEQAIESSFKGLSSQSTTTLDSVRKLKFRPDFVGSQMNIRDDTVHRAQLAFGYETFGYSHKHYLTLKVLQALLGNWSITDFSGKFSSHRLAEVFALEKLVDSYSTFNYNYDNSGVFGVYVASQQEEVLDDVVYEVFNQYQHIFSKINPHDIFRAKHQVISEYLGSISTPSGLASDAVQNIATVGRRIPPSEFVSLISQIKESDVYNLINDYFYDTDPVVVAHGPLEEMADYATIRAWTFRNKW